MVLSSTRRIFLRDGLRHEDAKDILGAVCSVLEDKTKVWHVKMPEFVESEMGQPSMKTPLLRMIEEDESNLNDYLDDLLTLFCVSLSSTMTIIGDYSRVNQRVALVDRDLP